uniref:Uncharacterized protein LOC111099409 n=1 Tax=Crassostrea virginica TaxID=6565 RepID=A0A8B8A4J8_CRAVI|nr:uncharacterized protein LOC111099409 [Crassostrea virginica]XP_022286397.1 uncharacterized protein LOC111099409 [Crassostrea virginica]
MLVRRSLHPDVSFNYFYKIVFIIILARICGATSMYQDQIELELFVDQETAELHVKNASDMDISWRITKNSQMNQSLVFEFDFEAPFDMSIHRFKSYRTRRDVKVCTQSLETAEIVPSCPRTSTEWELRTLEKNCSQFKHACSSFEYHCVINTWMNETVEVCAPQKYIVGKVCAEYNFGGNSIQRNTKASCERCPDVYNSAESFLYQECYRYVEDIKRSLRRTTFKSALTTLTSPKPNLPSKYSTLWEILSSTRTPFEKDSTSRLGTKSNVTMITWTSMAALLATGTLICVAWCCYRVHRRQVNRERSIHKLSDLLVGVPMNSSDKDDHRSKTRDQRYQKHTDKGNSVRF